MEVGSRVMKTRKDQVGRLLLNAFIIALRLGMLYPILWLIGASFKPSNMIFTDPGIWPKVFTNENYLNGWKGIGIVGFDTFFKNSFVICLLSAFANAIF